MNAMVPIVLFVYKRTDTLAKTLACLKANAIPRLIVYSDGAKGENDREGVAAVRQIVNAIDWCQVEPHFSDTNRGLGKSIMRGVTEVLEHYESCIVFEDDLVCVPGTYAWMCAALEHYKDDTRVYSVTGWTNRHLVPPDVGTSPWFDGRAECMTWGVWRRSWIGMNEETALEKMNRAKSLGIDVYRVGGDLPYFAKIEVASNIWAVRFVYHQIVNRSLTVRPPWPMVNHIGWGAGSTNGLTINWEDNGELRDAPPIPETWPEPREHPVSAALLRKMYTRPWVDRFPRLVPIARTILRKLGLS